VLQKLWWRRWPTKAAKLETEHPACVILPLYPHAQSIEESFHARLARLAGDGLLLSSLVFFLLNSLAAIAMGSS